MPMVSKMRPLHSLYQDDQHKVQHNSLVTWCHWHWHQCHIIPTASSVVPFHSFGKTIEMRCNWLFFVKRCHWHIHWHHIMPLAGVLMSCDATALVWESWDVNNTINGVTVMIRSRWSKWGALWLFWSCDTMDTRPGIMWCWEHCLWHHYISYAKKSKWGATRLFGILMPLALTSVSHDATKIINGTIAFHTEDNWNKV